MKINLLPLRFCSLVLFGIATTLSAGAQDGSYRWQQTNGSLALSSGRRIVWQLNFGPNDPKPCFHPLTLADGTLLTASHAEEHPWHHGLWFSWKSINGVNYWEEDKKSGKSEGQTELVHIHPVLNADYSARIEMNLAYHPSGKQPVMTEKRTLLLSAPDAQGNYSIDWDCQFTAGSEDLKMDRTPPTNYWGGYAGLSMRMAADLKSKRWTYTNSEGVVGTKNLFGQHARWMDYSGGPGIAIFDNPLNLRYPTSWYPNDRFPFCNATFLFAEPYVLKAGETLRLRYRVLIHSEAMDKEAIEKRWKEYIGGTSI